MCWGGESDWGPGVAARGPAGGGAESAGPDHGTGRDAGHSSGAQITRGSAERFCGKGTDREDTLGWGGFALLAGPAAE